MGLISGLIGTAPGVIVAQPNFVKKVVFPLEVLPAAMMGAMSFDLVIGFLLSLIGVMLLGTGFDFSILYLPIIILPRFYDRTWIGMVFLCPWGFH